MRPMTPSELIDHFGSVRLAAEGIGRKYQRVWAWADRGRIPDGEQCRIELVTKGSLKADMAQPVSQSAAA